MKIIKKLISYFSKFELMLWALSVTLILASFLLFDGTGYLELTASLTGVTALIFVAKGNPAGQVLTIVFSVFYGIISLSFSYWGEMITYLGMTAPMALISLIAWLKHPFKGNRAEVQVNTLDVKDILIMTALTATVTVMFYFILKVLNTPNIIVSTFSITTSFAAVYLTFRRSPYYAVAYALNDIVLIILWIMASLKDTVYISVSACFAAFLANDIYGFLNWRKMKKRQELLD